MYRRRGGAVEVLLVHPGGPFWASKDGGAWSVPKGEVGEGEDPQAAAQREFQEELGFRPPGEFLSLGEVSQKGGKLVRAWAAEGNCDPSAVRSNTFSLDWPPASGKLREFPEIDRAQFFSLNQARQKINPAQVAFIDRLEETLTPPGAGQNQSTRRGRAR